MLWFSLDRLKVCLDNILIVLFWVLWETDWVSTHIGNYALKALLE